MLQRCSWVGQDPIYEAYHDTEWGVPEYDSRALWEKLVLDGFQAGLSWITILKKRDAFREAFEGFDPERVARFGDADIERLLRNPGIVRHRGKLGAAITGARAIMDQPDLSEWMWAHVGHAPIIGRYERQSDVPTQSDLSRDISKQLKARGFKFCGPTIVYAWMEACGLFDNHLICCHRYSG
ncbi:MAG: DNA-3-methyladenine glycosylase I [Shimia sp.]